MRADGPDGTPRVLLVTSATHGHRSYGLALAAAFDRAGVAFDHLSVRRSLANRIVARPVPGANGRDLAAVRRQVALDLQLRSVARRSMARYPVVHVMPTGLARAFAKEWRDGVHLSVALDCTAELMRSDYGTDAREARLRGRLDRVALDRAEELVALSRWAADSVRGMGVVTPIDVVPPSAPVRTRRAGRTPGPVRIAFVGAPWLRKGGDRLLQWRDRLGPTPVELHVVCRDVPDGVADLPGVHVHGPMSRSTLIEVFLPTCDLLALPTRMDQSPWIVAEAAAVGLPVVASRMGGIPELVEDGRTGLLVDAADDAGFVQSLGSLVDDAGLRDKMADAALAFAARNLDEVANFDRLAARLAAHATRGPS